MRARRSDDTGLDSREPASATAAEVASVGGQETVAARPETEGSEPATNPA